MTDKTDKVKIKWPAVVVAILALVGLADASYLTFKFFLGSAPACVGGFDACGTVTQSVYASVGGVPISLFGALFYSLMLVLAVWWYQEEMKWLQTVMIFLVGTAFGFTGWLIYLQWQVLESWCFYCLLSASIITTLAVLLFWWSRVSSAGADDVVKYLDYDSAF